VPPAARRQIVGDFAALRKHRRDQQRPAQHVLGVQVAAGGIVRELQHHRPHDRPAVLMGLAGGGLDVGQQVQLEAAEVAQHSDRLVVELPGHPQAVAAVQAAVRGEQAESHPALVEIGRGRAEETADVVAPEAKAAQTQRQAAAQRLGH